MVYYFVISKKVHERKQIIKSHLQNCQYFSFPLKIARKVVFEINAFTLFLI